MTMDPLPSWSETPTRTAVLTFVAGVTDVHGPAYVPVPERVAVFDNDGTLWCEKPLPVQADFLLRRLAVMAEKDPSLTSRQPWKAAAAKDYGWLSAAITRHYQGDDTDLRIMAAGLLSAYEGTEVEEFADIARTFLRDGVHPTLDRAYTDCAYLPMVELLRYLTANRFTCLIATGGGRDILRTVSEEIYGIAPDRVIGSSVALEFRDDGDGDVRVVHTAELDVLDDGPAKPVRIWSRVGRRPILAAGNADGDVPMLRYAGTADRPGLRLLVRHDDPDREFEYLSGAETAVREAASQGWTVVSMRQDWTKVFDDQSVWT